MDDLQRLRKEYADREYRLSGSDVYSVFNPAYLFMKHSRQKDEQDLFRQHGVKDFSSLSILELGCGRGRILLEYLGRDVKPENLYGTDLLPDRVAQAHDLHPKLPLTCSDGQRLPYKSRSFDIVLQYTVFSSILDDRVKQNVADEMLRVLNPGGMIIWYDFWLNPTNPQTRGIKPAEIRGLFPGCTYDFHKITLAPPIARRLVPISWQLCALLEKFKLFNTHYLVAIRRNIK